MSGYDYAEHRKRPTETEPEKFRVFVCPHPECRVWAPAYVGTTTCPDHADTSLKAIWLVARADVETLAREKEVRS